MPIKSEALSLKTVINEMSFLKKTVIIQWNIWEKKDLLLLANKLMEKITDPHNAKERYWSSIRKKNIKSVKYLVGWGDLREPGWREKARWGIWPRNGGDQTIRAPWPIVEHYVFINDFNRFVYDYSIHRGRKHFFHYCFYAFITEEILELHIKYWFKINGKQRYKRPKKGEYVKLKNYERKRKSPFMIYADFESIVVPEDNGKQNSNES